MGEPGAAKSWALENWLKSQGDIDHGGGGDGEQELEGGGSAPHAATNFDSHQHHADGFNSDHVMSYHMGDPGAQAAQQLSGHVDPWGGGGGDDDDEGGDDNEEIDDEEFERLGLQRGASRSFRKRDQRANKQNSQANEAPNAHHQHHHHRAQSPSQSNPSSASAGGAGMARGWSEQEADAHKRQPMQRSATWSQQRQQPSPQPYQQGHPHTHNMGGQFEYGQFGPGNNNGPAPLPFHHPREQQMGMQQPYPMQQQQQPYPYPMQQPQYPMQQQPQYPMQQPPYPYPMQPQHPQQFAMSQQQPPPQWAPRAASPQPGLAPQRPPLVNSVSVPVFAQQGAPPFAMPQSQSQHLGRGAGNLEQPAGMGARPSTHGNSYHSLTATFGRLYKQGRMTHSMVQRMYWLKDGKLLYVPAGEEDAVEAVPLNSSTTIEGPIHKGKFFGFRVRTAGSALTLYAKTRDECHLWMRELQKAIGPHGERPQPLAAGNQPLARSQSPPQLQQQGSMQGGQIDIRIR